MEKVSEICPHPTTPCTQLEMMIQDLESSDPPLQQLHAYDMLKKTPVHLRTIKGPQSYISRIFRLLKMILYKLLQVVANDSIGTGDLLQVQQKSCSEKQTPEGVLGLGGPKKETKKECREEVQEFERHPACRSMRAKHGS